MPSNPTHQGAHAFSFDDIDGSPLPLSSLAGQAVLIVNTASKCGFTNQYKALQVLHQRYHERGLTILGVPCNDFGNQEPGTEAEIKDFCVNQFNIAFPILHKVHVKGPGAHPFYVWAAGEYGMIAKPRWNFHKYLVAPDGKLVDWFSTPTPPLSKRLVKAVEKVLPK